MWKACKESCMLLHQCLSTQPAFDQDVRTWIRLVNLEENLLSCFNAQRPHMRLWQYFSFWWLYGQLKCVRTLLVSGEEKWKLLFCLLSPRRTHGILLFQQPQFAIHCSYTEALRVTVPRNPMRFELQAYYNFSLIYSKDDRLQLITGWDNEHYAQFVRILTAAIFVLLPLALCRKCWCGFWHFMAIDKHTITKCGQIFWRSWCSYNSVVI